MNMKWYKFLSRFLIWAISLIGVIFGTFVIQSSAERLITADPMVIGYHPTIDKIYIISCTLLIGVSVLAVITGIALLKYKKYAPTLIIATFASLTAISAFYSASLQIYVATFNNSKIPFDLICIGILAFLLTITPSAAALILNAVYFKNRKHLFTE